MDLENPAGVKTCKGSEEAKGMSRLDHFLLFFPPNKLEEMHTITTRSVYKKDKPLIANCEIIKFISTNVLIARFKFSFRRK